MDKNAPTEELLARIKTLESKLRALEGNRKAAIDDHREGALREISSGISHNLNNLLTGMRLQAELIESISAEPEVLECVADIIHTGRRGAELVARLGLALRKNVPAIPHPIDLKTVVEDGVETSRATQEGESALEGRTIVLNVDVPEKLPRIRTTETGLIDIVKNANEALPEGGVISISARAHQTCVQLTVQDDGIGVDADSLNVAMIPFFTTKNDIGSGLGLSAINGLLREWGANSISPAVRETARRPSSTSPSQKTPILNLDLSLPSTLSWQYAAIPLETCRLFLSRSPRTRSLTICLETRVMGYTTDVHQFTVACKDNLPDHPTRISDERIAFIRQMVNDEMEELEQSETITEQADALVDAIYYICDFAATHGINLDPLFDIVHGANMQKIVDGKVIRRDDGKILKPEGWEDPGPKLDAEIDRQLEKGAFSNGSIS